MASATILVVDDDPDFVEIMRTILVSRGYRVITAANGAQALRQVAEAQPDLMILDINMPELNGLDFLKEFGKTPKAGKVPIIMLSTHTEKEIQDQAMSLGARAFLTKPFQKPELQALVTGLTGQSL